MGQVEIYKNVNRKELELFDLWKLQKSKIALFIDELQKRLGVLINYKTGTIIKIEPEKNYFEETVLRLVLNNEIYHVDALYFDDRQMMVRVVETQRLRRISLRVIKEVQWNAEVFDCRHYN